MSKFIYFPSFSAGAMGSSLAKNVKLKNDLSIRFYSDEFPEKYRQIWLMVCPGVSIIFKVNSPHCRSSPAIKPLLTPGIDSIAST